MHLATSFKYCMHFLLHKGLFFGTLHKIMWKASMLVNSMYEKLSNQPCRPPFHTARSPVQSVFWESCSNWFLYRLGPVQNDQPPGTGTLWNWFLEIPSNSHLTYPILETSAAFLVHGGIQWESNKARVSYYNLNSWQCECKWEPKQLIIVPETFILKWKRCGYKKVNRELTESKRYWKKYTVTLQMGLYHLQCVYQLISFLEALVRPGSRFLEASVRPGSGVTIPKNTACTWSWQKGNAAQWVEFVL